jgi:hypothetical protein
VLCAPHRPAGPSLCSDRTPVDCGHGARPGPVEAEARAAVRRTVALSASAACRAGRRSWGGQDKRSPAQWRRRSAIQACGSDLPRGLAPWEPARRSCCCAGRQQREQHAPAAAPAASGEGRVRVDGPGPTGACRGEDKAGVHSRAAPPTSWGRAPPSVGSRPPAPLGVQGQAAPQEGGRGRAVIGFGIRVLACGGSGRRAGRGAQRAGPDGLPVRHGAFGTAVPTTLMRAEARGPRRAPARIPPIRVTGARR